MFNLEDYETVEERLEKFWKDYPDGRIETNLVSAQAGEFIIQAWLYRTFADAVPYASGLAHEKNTDRGVNATSAVENCETSAIGRALANGGFAAKGKRPSREEMSKVASKVKANEEIVKAKQAMAQTSKEYIPVPKEDDPWSIKPVAQANTVESGIELIKEHLGAVEIKKLGDDCKCGKPMEWREGTSKSGKPWAHYTCTNVPSRKCQDPIWYEIAPDGSWKPQEKRA